MTTREQSCGNPYHWGWPDADPPLACPDCGHGDPFDGYSDDEPPADGQIRWTVTLVRQVWETAHVDVMAASEDEARAKALEIDEDRLDFSTSGYGEADVEYIEQH